MQTADELNISSIPVLHSWSTCWCLSSTQWTHKWVDYSVSLDPILSSQTHSMTTQNYIWRRHMCKNKMVH